MYWPLGQSARIKQEWQEDPRGARLSLIGLYILAFLPVTLIIKRWMSDGFCIILSLLFLYRSYRTGNWRWVKEPSTLIALGLWLFTLVVVTPFAHDPWASFSRAATWWRFILMFAAIVYWLSDYTEEIKRIAGFIIIVLALVATDAYIQYITGFSMTGEAKPENRLTGPLPKLVLGIYLAKLSFPALGILLYHAWSSMKERHIIACFALMTYLLVAIALSNERTALITFLAGSFLIGILLFKFLKNARRKIVILAIVQALLLYGVFTTQSEFQKRIAMSSEQAGNFAASPYAQLWKASYLLWKDDPFTGVGLMNFRHTCPALQEQGLVDYCDLHSHNVYLEWLAEAGIVGFLGIIAFVISLIVFILRGVRGCKPEHYILVSFALAGLMPTFFPIAATQSFLSNWPGMLAWLSLSLATGTIRSARRE